MARKKNAPEIDFFAEAPPDATATPNPALPSTSSAQPPSINRSILVNNDSNKMIFDNDMLVLENINKDHQIDIKDQLSRKEIKFLEHYLLADMTMEDAMISAGYVGYHPKSLSRVARQIVIKYERSGPGAQKIFREIGFGEIAVAKGIKKLAEEDKSGMVKLNAHQLAAKCLEMIKDTPTINQGIQIVIKCSQEETPTQQPGGYRPATIYLEQQTLTEKPEKP